MIMNNIYFLDKKPYFLGVLGIFELILFVNFPIYFNLPYLIFLMPIIIFIIIGIQNYYLYKISFIKTIIFNFSLQLFSDFLIRNNSTNSFDQQAQGLYFFLFFVTFLVSIVIMFFYCWLFRLKSNSIKHKWNNYFYVVLIAIVTLFVYGFLNY